MWNTNKNEGDNMSFKMALVATTIMLSMHAFMVAGTIRIALASENQLKLSAVAEEFQNEHPQEEIVVIPCKSDSMIPEQPLGKDTALKGARNRLKNLPWDIFNGADYVISIENYIEKDTNQQWRDRGLVLVYNNRDGTESELVSLGTHIPEQYVDMAKEMSTDACISLEGFSVTIGKAIQKAFEGRAIDPQDWHREIEFGGVSRKVLLAEAIFKALHSAEIAHLNSLVGVYQDFPKAGIIFEDFTPILSDGYTFGVCIDLLYAYYKDRNIHAVAGLESRGFIMGAALAYKLGVPFIPLRKPGKLPGPIFTVQYGKEYGTDSLSISQTALKGEPRVLIIDDLIATGGSAKAAIALIKLAGGNPIEFATLLEVKGLHGREKLGIPSFNLLD
jgi:adenine phosphoribosyltransferase